MRRSVALLTPRFQLLKTLHDHIAFERREAVDEEDAVAVVRLVLEAARGEFFDFAFVPFSFDILRAERRAGGAF